MWQYLVKRTALLLFTLLGICVLSFLVVTLAPGDPTYAALGLNAEGKGKGQNKSLDQVLENTRKALYLDRPAVVNVSPNTRRKVARELVAKICDGTEAQRETALKGSVEGEIGTAALDVLIEEAPARVERALAARKALEDAEAKLKALATDKPAELEALLATFEPLAKGRGPRFSKTAAPAERIRGWSAWLKARESDSTAGIEALLDALDRLVPADAGGPGAKGSLAERAKAWGDWWQKSAARYSPETASAAVAAYMGASDADRAARLDDVKKIGGAAVPPIMSAYLGASGAARRNAANALSFAAHKPWDMTEKASQKAAFEHEWAEKKAKLEKTHESGQIEEVVYQKRLRELGTSDEYVARTFTLEFENQERNIARWWFRSEENFVDFSAPRQLGRVFTQTQFGNWLRSILLGLDLGQSYTFKKDVSALIMERLPVSLWLNFVSIFLTYVIAIPLGIYSATHPRSLADRVMTIGLFLLYSLPSFWVGSILILVLTGPPGVNWFPSHGMSSMNAENLSTFRWILDVLWHLTLPTICLTYGGIAAISRFMRAGMLEVVRQDYIRTARAKGLSEKVVVFKHALRNSLIPILTLLAYLLPSMFGGSIIIESIFSIEGLGKLMFEAILNRDYPVIMAEVFISGFLTLLGILLADISYAIVDPRIELK